MLQRVKKGYPFLILVLASVLALSYGANSMNSVAVSSISSNSVAASAPIQRQIASVTQPSASSEPLEIEAISEHDPQASDRELVLTPAQPVGSQAGGKPAASPKVEAVEAQNSPQP